MRPSPALTEFVDRHRIGPGDDPLESLMQLSHTLHDCLQYIPGSTAVESPVEHIRQRPPLYLAAQDTGHSVVRIKRFHWDSRQYQIMTWCLVLARRRPAAGGRRALYRDQRQGMQGRPTGRPYGRNQH